MFDGLAPELQAILKYASEAESSNFYWNNTKRYADDLNKLTTEQGVKASRTPDSVMAAQLDAWDKVVDRIPVKTRSSPRSLNRRRHMPRT